MEYPGATRGVALAAILADLALAEPPDHLHPTVWMGRWLGRMRTRERQRTIVSETAAGHPPRSSLLHGILGLAGGLVLTTTAAGAVGLLLSRLGTDLLVDAPAIPRRLARVGAEAAMLKPALAVRSLREAAAVVGAALEQGDVQQARHLLGWHLVSRATQDLAPHEIAGAAIASLAENLNDSVVAPLLAYRLAGLPGAYGYRFVNTADAMLGYRTPELEWFGKPAARADDVLNLVPARLSVPLIALAAPSASASGWRAMRCAVRDASRTPSPNGGWPMAAMAGALGVRLEKRDHYVLNAEGRPPGVRDIARASRIVLVAALAAALCVELSIPGIT